MRTFLNLVIEIKAIKSLKIDTESNCLYQLVDLHKGSVVSIFHPYYFPEAFNMFIASKLRLSRLSLFNVGFTN